MRPQEIVLFDRHPRLTVRDIYIRTFRRLYRAVFSDFRGQNYSSDDDAADDKKCQQ